MSINLFTQKDNIKMLWEVIVDEETFQFLTMDQQYQTQQIFLSNIKGFFDNEKKKTNSLVDINKKYILLILNHIKKNYTIQSNKITIHQEPFKESITYEEIQHDRRSKFEKDLNSRQEEFDDFMTIKAPPVPEFADRNKDMPIKEMDKILKEIQTSRNYEIEQINRSYNNTNQVDNWLKPQETSLKNDKFDANNKIEQTQSYSRFKHLNNIDQELSPKDKKNVSFSNIEDIKTFNIEDENENDTNENENENDTNENDNIFSKLKKISNKQSENIKLVIQEQPILDNKFIDEDRILKLEKDVRNINIKMDKIIEMLIKK
jgi:hypothetical protein